MYVVLRTVTGKATFCPGIPVWNPAFDVTPADLITGGIITEHGVVVPPLDTKENLRTMKLAME